MTLQDCIALDEEIAQAEGLLSAQEWMAFKTSYEQWLEQVNAYAYEG